jgi:diacylglycerol kinase family enzyme
VLAILPAGTANLLAANLHVPADLAGAARVGLHGHRRGLDTGSVNGEHFAVMAGAGFDASMIKRPTGGCRRVSGLIRTVAAVSQSRENRRLPRMSVGWCSPRYIREVATSTGMATAGMRNSHRHQPWVWPITRIASAT